MHSKPSAHNFLIQHWKWIVEPTELGRMDLVSGLNLHLGYDGSSQLVVGLSPCSAHLLTPFLLHCFFHHPQKRHLHHLLNWMIKTGVKICNHKLIDLASNSSHNLARWNWFENSPSMAVHDTSRRAGRLELSLSYLVEVSRIQIKLELDKFFIIIF